MVAQDILENARNRLRSQWFVCRITSGRKSAQYGIRFSYPLSISLTALGIWLENPLLLSMAALIALFGIILPMHPFDYVFNYTVAKIFPISKIVGRGSELQVSSLVGLLFNLGVMAAIAFGIQLNYQVMALLYVAFSLFFIAVLLATDDFSFYSIYNLLFKRSK